MHRNVIRLALLALVSALALAAVMGGIASAKGGLSGAEKKLIMKEAKKWGKKFAKEGAAGTNGINGTNGNPGPEGPPGPSTGAAGGVLTGNYPNPGLADESVTTSSFAPGAIAPSAIEAELFGGLLPALWQKKLTGGCSAGQALTAISQAGAPTCQAFGSGNGTVTSVASGTGLTGGPITTSGTLAVDPTVVQNRISGTCASGEAVKAIAQVGTVTCEAVGGGAGDITEVTTSGGLTGGGTSGAVNVGVDPTQIQSRVSGTCASGEAVKAIAQNGTVVCEESGGEPELPQSLGAGETETGVFTGKLTAAGQINQPISFPVPTAVAPEPILTKTGEDKSAQGCPKPESWADPAIPEAGEGKLCLYSKTFTAVSANFSNPTPGTSGSLAGRTGTVMANVCAAGCEVTGIWAVTGEAP